VSAAAAARTLLDAYDHGALAPPPSHGAADFDWNAAYDIAAEMVRLRIARGERRVGRKIGFTNRNIWPQYGATSPIWSHVYDSTLIRARGNAATLSLRGAVSPRIEPELAFGLRAPVSPGSKDPARILEAVDWMAPSFEIVDCHYADWKFKPADSVADQSFHWRLIVGERRPVPKSALASVADALRDCRLALACDGKLMDEGTGSNALGHPALALAFLADILASQPQFDALGAGEIITTGTLTAALPIEAGQTWVSTISGLPLGPLTASFTV
jgi:2-oxo-3-hexenedioate decarboxylase